MNWDIFIEVWESFIDFMNTVFQWLQFVFGVIEEWPPENEIPDFNEGNK